VSDATDNRFYRETEPTAEYLITVAGCDASTRAIVALTDDEVAFVRRFVDTVNARSQYNCQPTTSVRPLADALADPDSEHGLDAEELAELRAAPATRDGA
jgi:hypothetical protein